MKIKRWTIVIIVILIWFLFPTKTTINIENTLGNSQEVGAALWLGGTIPIAATTSSTIETYAPKGFYFVTIKKNGFHDQNKFLFLTPNLLFGPREVTYTIQEKHTTLSGEFFDPTGTIKLDPYFFINGTDVRGHQITTTRRSGETIPFGFYDVTVKDVYFQDWFYLERDTLLKEGEIVTPSRLKPNGHFFEIDEQDLTYIKNFIREFVELSSKNIVDPTQTGLPKQYYMASQDQVISFGDMVFVLCQANSYKEKPQSYFVPYNKKYTMVPLTIDAVDCYKHTLHGLVPQEVDYITLSRLAGADVDYYTYDEMLNQKQRKGQIAFTFDIESGRYLFADNKGPNAINPCNSDELAKGIEPEDRKDCSNANRIGWFSPVVGEPSSDIPYPWSSGIRGFRTILDLSVETGIKSTAFVVPKEFVVYDEYDPTLLEDLQNASDQELIEIAYHSKYHSHLGEEKEDHVREEIREEKEKIEQRFGVDIVGFRGPYLSILENDPLAHERVLDETGFTYYTTDYREEPLAPVNKAINIYYVADNTLERIDQAQWNHNHVVTLDHPWNIYYVEKPIGGEVHLVYDESRADISKARIYETVTAGYIPVTMKDLE